MKDEFTIRVRVRLDPRSEKTLRALALLDDVLAELRQDLPWRQDVPRAIRAVRHLTRSLEVEEE